MLPSHVPGSKETCFGSEKEREGEGKNLSPRIRNSKLVSHEFVG